MTEILVCDDDLLQAQALAKAIKLAGEFLAEDYGQSVSVSAMGFPQEALAYSADRQVQQGIYFLDIEFAKSEMDGLDLAEKLLHSDPQGQVIFVTTHSELALQTFQRRIGTLDYIVKNADLDSLQERVVATLRLAMEKSTQLNLIKKQTFTYKVGRQLRNINTDDVYYVATMPFPHKLQLVAKNLRAEFVGNLKQLDQECDFLLKISQSCLVNPKNIAEIDLRARTISLVDGERLKYARSCSRQLRQLKQN